MPDVSDTGEVEPPGPASADAEPAGAPAPDGVPPPPDAPQRQPRDRRRLLRRALGVAVVLAVLAVGGVIANSKYQQHQRDVRRKQLLADQQAYLDAVRRLDRRISTDIAPVLHVLDAMSAPKPGDIFAARDAFANRALVQTIRRDYHDVVSLHVPTGWKGHAADLEQAVRQIRNAVNGLYKDRNSEDYEFLNTDIQGSQGGMLSSGVDDWRQALLSLFVERKEKAPDAVANAAGRHVPPTLTTWAFAVDRACISGNVHIAPLIRREHAGDHTTVLLRSIANVVIHLATSIRNVPLPQAQAAAIRRDLLSRVRVFTSEAHALSDEADAIDSGNLDAVRRDVDKLHTLAGGGKLLDSAFRRYHLIACAGTAGGGGGHSVQT